MTSIPPPNNAAPPAAPSTPAAPAAPTSPATGNSGVLTQLPGNLQSAGPGTIITGTVIGTDNHGQTLLQTNSGVVGFTTSATLVAGQQVSLQVQAAGSQLQAIIVASQPPSLQTPATAAAMALAVNTATAQAAATPAATIAPTVNTGPIVLATVIGPSAGAATPGSAASSPATTSQSPAGTAGVQSSPAAATGPTLSPSSAPSSAPSPGAAPSSSANAAPTTVTTAPATLAASPIGAGASTTAPAPTGAPPAAISGIATPIAAGAPLPTTNTSSSPPTTSTGTAPSAANPAPLASSAPAAGPPSANAPVTNAPNVSGLATGAQNAIAAGGSTVVTAQTQPQPQAPPAASAAGTPAPATNGEAAPVIGRPIATLVASYAASSTTPPPASTATSANTGTSAAAGTWPMASPGAQLQLRFIGVLPTLASAVASAGNGQLVATVIGQTPGGQTIVDTAAGHLAMTLPPNANVGNGRSVAFELISVVAGVAAESLDPVLAPQRALPGLGHEWPALKAVLNALLPLNAPLAQQVMEMSTARPESQQFLRQVLSFISSPASDVRTLLGHTAMATLEQAGHGELTMRLDADLREMNRLNSSPTDWRMFFVPMMETNELRQLRVFTRKKKSGGDAGRDGGGRFIVEIEFKELGPLQLDGLVQKPRIDLILRSHAQLTPEMQHGITDVFNNTCAAAGLAGKLFFQATPLFPVSPLDEMTRSSGAGLSV